MRALIVDDEPLARWELRRLLQSHAVIDVVGEARDAEEALQMIRQLNPDLLFLDIQMPGLSGFELLERLGGKVPQVIFTTAYQQHALRAFEVNALDYLLKPIAPERLALAVGRLLPTRPGQIFVQDGDRCWIARLEDIFLLESEGNYTRLYFGQERPLIRRSLSALESQLDSHRFFRANRRQILNLAWIDSLRPSPSGGLVAVLRNGPPLLMSRRRSERLRNALSL